MAYKYQKYKFDNVTAKFPVETSTDNLKIPLFGKFYEAVNILDGKLQRKVLRGYLNIYFTHPWNLIGSNYLQLGICVTTVFEPTKKAYTANWLAWLQMESVLWVKSQGVSSGVMVKAMDCRIVVREFVL